MLKDIITSEVRIKIINEFYRNTDTSIHIRDMARRVSTEINAVRRELDRFHKCGMLKKEGRLNRVYYSLKKEYSSYRELLSFVYKEQGLGATLLKGLAELGKVKFILMSTEFIEGRKASSSQVDVLLVGTVDLGVLQGIIKSAEHSLGREINYCVLGEEEFLFRKSRRDPLVLNTLVQGRIILYGDENKFCQPL